MKRSNRLVILVGVLLAVLAFVGIVVLLGQTGNTPATVEKTTVDVLVAKADIALGESVTPDKVDVKPVDPGDVSGTRIGDPSQLTGKPALFPIAKGQQVSQEVFGTTSTFCIVCQLQAGEKAIAFQVDPVTGLDFLIQPGDHVDIIYRTEVSPVQPTADSVGSSNPRLEPIAGLEAAPTVKVLLQDKRVLYVSATKIQPVGTANATPAPGDTSGAAPAAIESVIIVFAGSDADAEMIKFAQTDSVPLALTAILRATGDVAQETTTGITLRILVDTFGIPVPNLIQITTGP